jgi:hypothetical protein
MPAAERSLSLSLSLSHTHTRAHTQTPLAMHHLSPFHFEFKDFLYIMEILCGLTALLDFSYGIVNQI